MKPVSRQVQAGTLEWSLVVGVARRDQPTGRASGPARCGLGVVRVAMQHRGRLTCGRSLSAGLLAAYHHRLVISGALNAIGNASTNQVRPDPTFGPQLRRELISPDESAPASRSEAWVLKQSDWIGGRLRRTAKALLPPIMVPTARWVAARGRFEWKYLPTGWPTDNLGGWDDTSIVDAQLLRWPAYVASLKEPSALRLASMSRNTSTDGDYSAHNTAMVFAYVLSLASRGRDRLSFLDWGGGLGQYAVLARSLVPSLELEYHCRDLPLLVRAGRNVLPNDSFYDSDEQALARTYDLVMASSSLQYVQDWRAALGRLAAATTGYLLVTRQPFLVRSPSFVVVQRPHRHGYTTEYPGWFLNRNEFLESADGFGLRLRREFLIAERPFVPRAPEQAEYRGFLFEPTRRVRQ